MHPRLDRIRSAEALVGVASLGLLVVLFATTWYRASLPASGVFLRVFGSSLPGLDRSGWESLSILAALAVIVGVLGLSVPWLQAVCRAPALPVCATAFELVLSFILTAGLVVRVLIALPAVVTLPPIVARSPVVVVHAEYGAYLGLALALLVCIGCYRSMRDEWILPADGPAEIEVVHLSGLERVE